MQALFQGPQDSIFEFTTRILFVPNTSLALANSAEASWSEDCTSLLLLAIASQLCVDFVH